MIMRCVIRGLHCILHYVLCYGDYFEEEKPFVYTVNEGVFSVIVLLYDHFFFFFKVRVCNEKVIFLFLNQNICCGY